jgi:hypothetical protein
MANIPEDGVVLSEDSALADESDPDKRIPQQLWDKTVALDNEFEEGKSGNRNDSVAKKEKEVSAALIGDGAASTPAATKTEEAMEVDGQPAAVEAKGESQ